MRHVSLSNTRFGRFYESIRDSLRGSASGEAERPRKFIWCFEEENEPSKLKAHDKKKVVWQNWIEYDERIAKSAESCYHSNKKAIFDFFRIDKHGRLTGVYIMDLEYMVEVDKTTGDHRRVKRVDFIWCRKEDPSVINKRNASKVVGDPKEGWILYDEKDIALLEDSFCQSTETQCTLEGGFVVFFDTMKQSRYPHGDRRYQKDVRRLPTLALDDQA